MAGTSPAMTFLGYRGYVEPAWIPGSPLCAAPRNDVGAYDVGAYTSFTILSGRLRTGLPVAA